MTETVKKSGGTCLYSKADDKYCPAAHNVLACARLGAESPCNDEEENDGKSR